VLQQQRKHRRVPVAAGGGVRQAHPFLVAQLVQLRRGRHGGGRVHARPRHRLQDAAQHRAAAVLRPLVRPWVAALGPQRRGQPQLPLAPLRRRLLDPGGHERERERVRVAAAAAAGGGGLWLLEAHHEGLVGLGARAAAQPLVLCAQLRVLAPKRRVLRPQSLVVPPQRNIIAPEQLAPARQSAVFARQALALVLQPHAQVAEGLRRRC